MHVEMIIYDNIVKDANHIMLGLQEFSSQPPFLNLENVMS